MKESYCLFTFDDTHHAIAAQERLEPLSPLVMPTLRSIRASCGMSLRLPPEREAQALALMAQAEFPWQLWLVDGEGHVTERSRHGGT